MLERVLFWLLGTALAVVGYALGCIDDEVAMIADMCFKHFTPIVGLVINIFASIPW